MRPVSRGLGHATRHITHSGRSATGDFSYCDDKSTDKSTSHFSPAGWFFVHSDAARFLHLAVIELSCQHCIVSCLAIPHPGTNKDNPGEEEEEVSSSEDMFGSLENKKNRSPSNIRKNVNLVPAQWPLLLARPAASGRHTTRVPGCADCMRWEEVRGDWRVARRLPTPRAAPMCCSPAQRVGGGHGDR